MDQKTEELRDIFLDVADDAEVTETQEEGHGSLASEAELEERLEETVAEMRADLGFGTSLDDDDLVTVVRGFYEGLSDTEIARELGDASLSKTVARARVELHLVRDSDRDAPFDLDALRDAVDRDVPASEFAEAHDVSPSTVRRYRRVVEAEREIERVNDRYREEFEAVLQDRELAERLTENALQDGLEEATEGQETDVQL
ncbi:MAG: conditioned medium-induced protein 4 [Halobacteriaceae archaeon]